MNWQAKAKQILAEGYVPGAWQQMLRNALLRTSPLLVQELGANLEAYLIVKTAAAKEQEETMIEQGTAPQTASDLALTDLLDVPEQGEAALPATATVNS